MKPAIVAAMLTAFGFAPALAANNTDCSTNTSDQISGNSITALLVNSAFSGTGNNFAQYPAGGPDVNDESLVSPSAVWDYKKGAAGPGVVDPSTVVGSYVISGAANRGTIAYTYGGTTYTYFVSVLVSGASHTVAGGYLFCVSPAGTPVLHVTVQQGHF